MSKNKLSVFLFSLPFSGVYSFLVWLSSDTAKDRGSYRRIFSGEDPVRTEVGYTVFVRGLNHIVGNADLTIVGLQFFVFCFAVLTFINLSKSDGTLYAKALLWVAILLSVFSLLFGVQIRFGLAVVLAVWLVARSLIVMKHNVLIYLLLGVIFSSFQYGIIPFLLIALCVRSSIIFGKLAIYWEILILTITLSFSIDLGVYIVELVGLSPYYLIYFDGGFVQERLISFSFIAYACLLFMMTFLGIRDRVAFLGISFFLASLLTEAVVYQKMGLPFLMYAFLVFILRIKFKSKDVWLWLAVAQPVLALAILYFSLKVSLI